MDGHSSKRSSGGVAASRKGSSLVLRDSTESNRDRNIQVCSRVGCSSRLNLMKDTQIGSPSKAKTSKTASSSRKPWSDTKMKLASQRDNDPETFSLQDKSEEVTGKSQMRNYPPIENQGYPVEASSSEAGSSSSRPITRFMKKNSQRIGFGHEDCGPSSSASFGFKQATQGEKNGGASTSRYNPRHLKCYSNSISDVVPSGSSVTPESSSLIKKRDTSGRKRIGEAESSSSVRGKKINGTIEDDKKNNDVTKHGISITDSRHTRSSSPGNSDVTSVRPRRLSSRTRFSNQESQDRLPLVESPLADPSSPQLDLLIDEAEFSFDDHFASQIPANPFSFSQPGTESEHIRFNRSIGPHDFGIARSFMDLDNSRQYNLDGFAEMLLALERIEQNEEPTHEQLDVLGINLFLEGLAFHDQHIEMMLDIDNLSYEELLALEERMGNVSTAVPEDVLAKCLRKSVHQSNANCRENEVDIKCSICQVCLRKSVHQSNANCRENEVDIKCSICQEEYADGEDVGRLGCDHKYHIECINQWLRLKNWCPICKIAVAPSSTTCSPT